MNDLVSAAKKTRITILVDNDVQPDRGLFAEHGFAALIERDDARILFDTGKGNALIPNAETLGVNLTGLTHLVLSHGHYDHTGGVEQIVARNPSIRVIAHPRVFGAHFALNEDEDRPHDIGIPAQRASYESHGARFELTSAFTEIVPGVWFTGYVPRRVGNMSDGRLLTRSESGFITDALEDDASLILATPSGPVLMLGCAHAGVRNILELIREKPATPRLHAVIGGTHLGFCGADETAVVLDALEDFDVQVIAACHCTGKTAQERIRERFPDRAHEACAGTVFEF